ncbi:MAG: phage/plasmid primase, P4 family [Desulfuromonadales bacterium]
MVNGSGDTAVQDEIRRQVAARIEAEAPQLAAVNKPQPETITADLVGQCLEANELGDGVLFSAMHKGKFVFNVSSGEWLTWAGHYWDRDVKGLAHYAVEKVALRYLQEASTLGRQLAATSSEDEAARLQKHRQRIMRRVEKLRSVKGRERALTMATTCGEGSLVVTGEQLDTSPWLLGCRNGVVDLRTGELRPGRPDDLITLASPFDFPTDCGEYLTTGKNTPCPSFEQFALEIMDGNTRMAGYLQRLFGYGLTGLTTENIFVILFGHGRNGKSLFIETVQKVLGPLACPIAAEMLLDQGRVRNSSGPSPDIMSLKGKRLTFASETEQHQRFASSRVKWLSGGDSLTGRAPHDRDVTTFAPSHLLCLATNFRPRANSDDRPFWLRMHMVDFPLSFVANPSAPNERPVNKSLGDQLAKEAPGVLAWLVRGCLLWQRDGLAPPPEVLAAVASYRRTEDDLAEFLEERCITDPDSHVTAKALYESFKGWYTSNVAEKVPSQKKFGEAMSRRFAKDKNGPGGTNRYLGLELKRLAE